MLIHSNVSNNIFENSTNFHLKSFNFDKEMVKLVC